MTATFSLLLLFLFKSIFYSFESNYHRILHCFQLNIFICQSLFKLLCKKKCIFHDPIAFLWNHNTPKKYTCWWDYSEWMTVSLRRSVIGWWNKILSFTWMIDWLADENGTFPPSIYFFFFRFHVDTSYVLCFYSSCCLPLYLDGDGPWRSVCSTACLWWTGHNCAPLSLLKVNWRTP